MNHGRTKVVKYKIAQSGIVLLCMVIAKQLNMKKGQMVYVEGRLHTREWEDQNQIKRKTTEVDVIILQC